ncbi:MAG: DUF6382 domain-containing protein [Syntrophomonas sp.]
MGRIFEDYTYDYVDQNGRFLLISKEPGLEMGDVDALQKNMIYSNSINRLLNMEVEERDFAVRLRYTVGPRRSLKNVLRSRRMSRNEFYQVLLDTINTIQSSRDYMLNGKNFLLLSDFIFVGHDLSDLHFVYLPLKDLPGKTHLTEEFEQIILELSQCTDGLRQQEQTMLINFCRDREQFSPENLRRIIIATQGQEERKPDIRPSQPVREPVVQRPAVNEMAVAAPVENHPPRQAPQQAPPGKASGPVNQGKAPERLRTMSLSVAVVALAAIWKIYMGHPGEGYLYICIGASILVADAVFILLKVWPWGNDEIQAPGLAGAPEVKASPAQPVSYQSLPMQGGAQVAPASTPYPPEQTPVAASQAAPHPEYESEKAYYDSLPDRTSILSPSNETGLLNLDEVVKPAAARGVWLEVERGGVKERLPIEGNSFVVGRKGSAVDYVENGSGVSRVHMELVKTAAGWIVRDLDSKNGTFINGEKLIPNKDYPLVDGCRLKIATAQYTFHID